MNSTIPAEAPAYPLAALVGCEDVLLALSLCAVDPSIGGVLLRGEKGSGKTTAARGLAAVLPGDAPFIDLPLGAGEDRVVGTFDVAAALGTGEYRFQAGLLHAANGGVLYVDEVNLLADHLVDVLLDAAATGVHRVERDGISRSHPARFVLIGSMNPEEGDLRPQLLDRFGLSVTVLSPSDPHERAEAVRRRLAYDADPVAFAAHWQERSSMLRDRLSAARDAVGEGHITLSEESIEAISAHIADSGAEGLRADLVTCRAAVALAGLEGKGSVGEGEIERVLPLVLGHRASVRRRPSGGAGAHRPDRAGAGAGEPSRGGEHTGNGRASTDAGNSAGEAPRSRDGSEGDEAAEPQASSTPADGAPPSVTGLLDPGTHARPRRGASESGRRAGPAAGGTRGRVIGARPLGGGEIPSVIEPLATVRAAAGRVNTGSSGGPLPLESKDLRAPVRRPPVANLVVLAVDASGSMGAENRIAAARDVAQALLVDAYQRRDRVAVVTFAGKVADVLLRPTGSTEVAGSRLLDVPTGGTTPLAEGIVAASKVVATCDASAYRRLIVLFTDGRATWAEGDEAPMEAALRAARTVALQGIDALVIDCETGRSKLGLATRIADAMGATYAHADMVGDSTNDGLDPRHQLAETVRERLRSTP